jgi:hypothetical protein
MKLLHPALAALLLLSPACSDGSGSDTAPAPTQDSAPAAAAAPVASTTPPAPAASLTASSAPGASAAAAETAAATEAEAKSTINPDHLRGGQRYEGGLEKLDSGYDLSKVDLNAAAKDDHDHDHDHGHDAAADEHAGHDHAKEDPGARFTPAGRAEQLKGRIALRGDAPQVKDLGRLRQGDMGSFEFPFVSAGDEPLVITGVKPSCGCTKSDIVLVGADGTRTPYTKGDPIPVGQGFVLESEVSTDGKPGGPFNATIAIYANDVRGVFTVRLTAEIEPVLTISPSPSVFFGRITTADKVEQGVSVSTTRGEPFVLSLGTGNVEESIQLEYVAKEPNSEGKSSEWEVRVALGPNAEVGMKSYPLHFKTDLPIAKPKYPSPDGSPQFHSFVLNVQAQVTGMVSAEPSFITFGMVKPGDPIERKLRITCHDDFQLSTDMPVVFEGLQGQEFPFADAFEVTVVPLEGGKEADLVVKLKGLPEELNGSFGGQIKVQVGHPHLQELHVRFSGVCRPGLPTQTQPAQQPPQK